jgi:hypothetical protein
MRGPSTTGRRRKWSRHEWAFAASMAAAVATVGGALISLYDATRTDAPANQPTLSPLTTAAVTIPPITTTARSTTTQRPTTTTLSASAAADAIWTSIETNPTAIDTFNDFGEVLMVPRRARIVGGPPGDGCDRFHSWALDRGGVAATDTYLRLVIQGRDANAVLLTALRAKVLERRPPMAGIPLTCGAGGAGATIRYIRLNLDERPAVGRHGQMTDDQGFVTGKPFAFTLKRNETEIFDVWASTERCWCRWVLELELVVNGTRATKTLSNNGRPFQTTAWSGHHVYNWADAWYLDAGGEPQPPDKPLQPPP